MAIINHHAIVWSTTQTTIEVRGAPGTIDRYYNYSFTVPNVYRSNPVIVAHTSRLPSQTLMNAFVYTTSGIALHFKIRTSTTINIAEGRWVFHTWRTGLQTKQPDQTTIS